MATALTHQLRAVLTVGFLSLHLTALGQDKSATIDDFAFLQGLWIGTGFGGVSEEMWMPARDGSMFGGLNFTLVEASHLRIELRLQESNGAVTTEVFEMQKRPL